MLNHDIECATANIEQSLIELIADFLDSNDVEFEQSVARIRDPEPREKTGLHIRMAKKAMEAYKSTMVHYDGSGVLSPIIIAEQSEATVCPRCAEFRKTHGKDSECVPCGLKRINNRQTG